MKKLFLLFILVLIMGCSKTQYTLEDYPKMFIKNGNIDVTFVTGDKCPAQDIVTQGLIMGNLQMVALNEEVPLQNKLSLYIDTEIETFEKDMVIISTGDCNQLIKKLGYDNSVFEEGKSITKLLEKNGNYIVLVLGETTLDTEQAAKSLYKEN